MSAASRSSGGRPRRPAELRAALREEPAVKAVLLTHNETSTGVTNPIPELAAAVREVAPEALILVDAISALGAVPFAMDAWALDLVVTGSQKAWMSAPGMAFAAVGERAWTAMETARMPRFYFDLRRARESAASGPDALDAGRCGPLPGRRGPAPHGGGDAGGRLHPSRRLRRG